MRDVRAAKAAIEQAKFLAALDLAPYERELTRRKHAQRGGLYQFVKDLWHVLEPETEFVSGWPIEAICSHLEAAARGEINRLLITVPPGFSKSLCTSVFLPAWIWGALDEPYKRFLSFSYSASLTERDNLRMRQLISSPEYQALYGDRFQIANQQITNVRTDKTGFKLASSVGGVATGQRGDFCLIDDAHKVDEAESERVRTETVRWFSESISSRFNSLDEGVMVVIMQRVHEDDLAGHILSGNVPYCNLMIPWNFDPLRSFPNAIGWLDPRHDEDNPNKNEGKAAWTERFSELAITRLKEELGPYAFSGQFQQSPAPRGGGIIPRESWRLYDPPNNKYPQFEFCVASLDASGFTSKKENDPAAMTVWAVWRTEKGEPALLLVDGWCKRLPLHCGDHPELKRLPHELSQLGDSEQLKRRRNNAYAKRVQHLWGVVELTAWTCAKFGVDRLLIENAKEGIAVAQEMQRLYRNTKWMVQLLTPKGDKVARAHSVVPMFVNGLIWAPNLDWADMVIDAVTRFPRGHDDITDSTTQALRYLRDNGLIKLRTEERAEELEQSLHRSYKPKKLYPV